MGRLTALVELARLLSGAELERVAERLAMDGSVSRAGREVRPEVRAQATTLLDAVVDHVGDADLVASVLSSTAALVAEERPTTEPVWSGPILPGDSNRTTGAVVRLIDEAAESIWASTYSSGRTAPFVLALKRAMARGVEVTVVADVVELVDVAAMLVHVLPEATILGYHHEVDSRAGLQHSKIVIIDGETVLVTSANLSTAAVEVNLEAGLITKDPVLASRMVRRLVDLRMSDHLRPVTWHQARRGQPP